MLNGDETSKTKLIAFDIVKNLCSGLKLILIICCNWPRGNVL